MLGQPATDHEEGWHTDTQSQSVKQKQKSKKVWHCSSFSRNWSYDRPRGACRNPAYLQ